MDDDGGDWFAGGDDPPPPEPVKKSKKEDKKEAAPEEPAPAAEEPPPPEQLPEAVDDFIDPDKLLLFKHWIRPKFLQYSYLYNYRHNYYDDVIDYLDKRQKGLSREVPRAQTWAERVLRSTKNGYNREEYFRKASEDTKLVTRTQISGSFFCYRTKQYVNKKFSSLLY